jgi:hypothetical protein
VVAWTGQHSGEHHSDVTTRRLRGSVLGYVTPWWVDPPSPPSPLNNVTTS